MKPLRIKPLWKYVKALDASTIDVFSEDTLGATGNSPTDILLLLYHPGNWDVTGRIDTVTHEVIHHVHSLTTLADPDENKAQEDEINRLATELCLMTEWNVLVLYKLEEAIVKELLHAKEAREYHDRGKN